MEPAIGVYANSLTGKLLDVARFVNGLQQWEKTYSLSAQTSTALIEVLLTADAHIPSSS